MANKNLFDSLAGLFTTPADTCNDAGGLAYKLTPKQALAQYAATGCFNQAFYAGADEQLSKVLELCKELEPDFIAKTAIYSRKSAFMKDVPALLVAVLSVKDKAIFEAVFPKVIDNGKMLRNFVQIMRSGVVGRKSLGSLPKRMIREWFMNRSPNVIFSQSVGQSPSFGDILKMIHIKPKTPEYEALFGYLIGKTVSTDSLPEKVKALEAFRNGETTNVPDVPFQMLTSLKLSKADWMEIAKNARWQMTRMNLMTFNRHGVLSDPAMTKTIADRLRDPKLVRSARAFPYQLMMAYSKVSDGGKIPREISESLQDAMEIATENVPLIEGKVYVLPDVSGSMSMPVTGYRQGSTSSVRCIEVASLITAAILRMNPMAEVLPFENSVRRIDLNPRDSIMTNATKLAGIGGGGTNCSAPLYELNRKKARGDMVIYVSDNESWIDSNRRWNSGTETLKQWNKFRSRNPAAKLVCIDIQPYAHTQAAEREDILNIGGFSDRVFDVIAQFSNGTLGADHWVGEIEKTSL